MGPKAEGSMATPRMEAYSFSTSPKAAIRSKPGEGWGARDKQRWEGRWGAGVR